MIRRFLPAFLLLACASIAGAQFTPANTPIKITEIKPSLEKSPEFSVGIGPQRKSPSADWLWVEVAFTYNPALKTAPPIDDLVLNYYILLNNKSKEAPLGTLLTGTITHTGVTPGTEVRRSVALVSPQTLKRFFGGRTPPVTTLYQAIGVTATISGMLAAEDSIGAGKGKPQWWLRVPQGQPGLVLSKDQTPFAPLFYDYFEAVKTKGGQ